MIRKYKWLIGIAALVIAASTACALKNRHIAVVGNVAVYESLATIQDTADTLVQTKAITQEQRKEIAKYLLPALETGRAIAKLTASWPADKPAPAELQTLTNQLKEFVDKILAVWPDSPAKAAIATRVAQAQQVTLALVMIFASS